MASERKVAKSSDKETLRNFVSAFAGLTDVTYEMLGKQLRFVRELAIWGAKFQEAQSRISFWKGATKDLDPAEVAILFVSLGKMGEMTTKLQTFGTLKSEEQDKIVNEYKEVKNAFDQL